jgi:uncharacterized protein
MMLSQIARAEAFIRAQGFQELRVRHHGGTARIEVRKEDFARLSVATVKAMRHELKDCGFRLSVLDIEGYRSGVFNERLQNNDK